MVLFWLLLCWSSMEAIAFASATSTTPANMLIAANTTKPGCPRKCGSLTIPYPFGIGPNCSNGNSWFSVFCDNSYNPPKAFSMVGLGFRSNPEILDISETQIVIRNSLDQITVKCYGIQGNVVSNNFASYDISDSPFTYSDTANKLTVIGCMDYALITQASGTGTLQERGNASYSRYRAGCLAVCSKPNEATNGSCSGLGCCQTSIPVGLQSLTISLSSLDNRSTNGISSSQPCSYAFLAGNGRFKFGGAADLIRNSKVVNLTVNQVPLVLDWAVDRSGMIKRPTCKEAISNETNSNGTTYACQSNTICIDFKAGGYHCNCTSGYEGNPYLKPGCTDIDECAGGLNNPCTKICINTPGSYKCACPSGCYGDGHKFGTGCTKISNGNLKKVTFGISISLGTIFLLLGGWWLYSMVRRRKATKQKAKHFERNGGFMLQQQMSSDESIVNRMKIFTIDELDRATDHFNVDRILGQGGQGTVFKGMLREGRIVAVKKSKIVDESQIKEFINEVVILSQISHRNIVKLLGCCLETEVPLLVYEFIPNGNLFHHIHYPNEEFPITWKMRLQIAIDSAGALAYLHSSSSMPVFHRDIKSSNILLDDKYRAKLSDFGTSRSVAIDQTHLTTRVLGTFGYLDPEYFQSSQFTEKSDVYSFGVVLVELLTGEKAIRSTSDDKEKSLTSWFLSHVEASRLFDTVDSKILKEASTDELLTIANNAKQCLNLDGKRRPTMRQVVAEIEAVRSLHLSRTNQQNWPEMEQEWTQTTHSSYDSLSSFGTSYLENKSLSSSNEPLLFSTRS